MELAEWLYGIPQRVVPAVSTVMAAVRHSMQVRPTMARAHTPLSYAR